MCEFSFMFVICFNFKIGYDMVSKVVKNVYKKGLILKESVMEMKVLIEEEFDFFVKLELMVGFSFYKG